jgi:hypothetical protein
MRRPIVIIPVEKRNAMPVTEVLSGVGIGNPSPVSQILSFRHCPGLQCPADICIHSSKAQSRGAVKVEPAGTSRRLVL